MKPQIAELLSAAVTTLKTQGTLPADLEPRIQIENTRDKAHGDLATNLAMMLAKPAGKNPRELAQLLVAALPVNTLVAKTDIAGPGFINFYLSEASTTSLVQAVLEHGCGNAAPAARCKWSCPLTAGPLRSWPWCGGGRLPVPSAASHRLGRYP